MAAAAEYSRASIEWTPEGYLLRVPLDEPIEERASMMVTASLGMALQGVFDDEATVGCYVAEVTVRAESLLRAPALVVQQMIDTAISSGVARYATTLDNERAEISDFLDALRADTAR